MNLSSIPENIEKIRKKELKRTFVIQIECDEHHELSDMFPELY